MKLDEDLQTTLSWGAVGKTSRGDRIGLVMKEEGAVCHKEADVEWRAERVRVSPRTTIGHLQALLGKL